MRDALPALNGLRADPHAIVCATERVQPYKLLIMSICADRHRNSRRMSTCRFQELKSLGMNTCKKMGEGAPA
jgi:hypothetical protein